MEVSRSRPNCANNSALRIHRAPHCKIALMPYAYLTSRIPSGKKYLTSVYGLYCVLWALLLLIFNNNTASFKDGTKHFGQLEWFLNGTQVPAIYEPKQNFDQTHKFKCPLASMVV